MHLQDKLKMMAEVELHGVDDDNVFGLKQFIDEVGIDNDITIHSERGVHEQFYEILDDTHESVSIAGIDFSPSEIFKDSAGDTNKRVIIGEYISNEYFDNDNGYYISKDELDQFYESDFEDCIDEVKQYVIDQEGYEENSSQARAIESANDFTDLHSRYAVMQSSSELKSAISEVQGETQSPGLADVEVQSNTERQSKVRKI